MIKKKPWMGINTFTILILLIKSKEVQFLVVVHLKFTNATQVPLFRSYVKKMENMKNKLNNSPIP